MEGKKHFASAARMPIEIRGLKVILLLFLYDHQDILENDDIKLENIFIASMVNDLIKGMTHLHKTDLHFHGNLKSSNCVVTSRWVLQITDYGLHELRAAAEKDSIGDHELYRSKFDRVNVIVTGIPVELCCVFFFLALIFRDKIQHFWWTRKI